ncbi:MAG: HAMP domain-containing histidine kinase [Clostridia bacterium]|nr:HAMP domain-containing histidine kinase [Clostridia bacterium]
MRSLSMFSRLLIVSLSVILVCVAVLSGLTYTYQKNSVIDSRMDALKTQARDIGYLASRLSMNSLTKDDSETSAVEEYINWKSRRIYDDYGAYTMVVDRTGKYFIYYLQDHLREDTQKAVPSADELAEYMDLAMQGQEVVKLTQSSAGPFFTVMVPWVQNNSLSTIRTVMGYVLIQTAAQTVHAVYQDMIWQTALAAVGVFLFAAVVVFFVAQQITNPISAMAKAAGQMARGNFDAKAPEEGGKEIAELGRSFNQMAVQLSSLEQSRRDFVANVSHELRSPVTSIKGFAQGMLDGTIPSEMHEQYLQVVVDETQRLAKLINNLLNLSRMENQETSLAYSHFDLNETARRVLISRMTQIDEKSLDIDVQFENESCYVHADADQIEQVIINLLDNAIKYTPDHGTVTLITKQEGDHVILRVKDNGVGVPAADAPFIFDRFYKVDKAHTVGKGTGLGLAICKRIMERHNQQIRLVSGENGAEFEITLEKGTHPGGNHGDTGAG